MLCSPLRASLVALLTLAACGYQPDAPATPTALQGVHATSVVANGQLACLTTTAAEVKCVDLTVASPTLVDMPRLNGATLIQGGSACGVLPDHTVRCVSLDGSVETQWAAQDVASAAFADGALFHVDTHGGLHASPSSDGKGAIDIGLDGATATQVAADYYEVCAVLAGGTPRCWPYQITADSTGLAVLTVSAPNAQIAGVDGVTQLTLSNDSSGASLVWAVTSCGVTSWSDYPEYAADGSFTDNAAFNVKVVTNSAGAVSASIVDVNGCLVTASNDLMCWQSDGGDPKVSRLLRNIQQVSVGSSEQSVALQTDGTILVWGGYHQVGPSGPNINLINLPTY